jgi:hypothetical protein
MDSELRRQVEDFLYLEAELLDERKLREWFELLSEDIRYWMPIRHNTLERSGAISEELSKPGEGYYFDDDIKSLKIRVERAYSKIAWAEVPPSRTRHLITNIRIKKDDGKSQPLGKLQSKEAATVTIPAPPLTAGHYVLEWSVFADRSRVLSGRIRFTISGEAVAAQSSTQ